MFSCEFPEISKNTFFQNIIGWLLLFLAVSIELKGEMANETVNYDSKTKAYVPIWARSVSYQKRAVLLKEQVSDAVVRSCEMSV